MPLTEKIFRDFYMLEVLHSNIKVEYWDLTLLFFKDTFEMEDSSKLVTVFKLKNYQEFENKIKKEVDLSKILFVSIMRYELRISKLYVILTKLNCTISVFGRNMFTTVPVTKNLLYYFSILKISTILDFINKKRLKSLEKENKIKKYDIVFIGGNQGWKGIGRIDYDDIKLS